MPNLDDAYIQEEEWVDYMADPEITPDFVEEKKKKNTSCLVGQDWM